MAYVPAPTKQAHLRMTDDYKTFVAYSNMCNIASSNMCNIESGVAVILSKEYKCQYCGRVWCVDELSRTSCATCGAPKGN